MWGNKYKTYSILLQLLQKKVIKIIHGYREHSNVLFNNSGFLKLEYVVKEQTLLGMFKNKNREVPASLQKLFVFTSEDKNHRRKYDFRFQAAYTTLKQRFFYCQGEKFGILNRRF